MNYACEVQSQPVPCFQMLIYLCCMCLYEYGICVAFCPCWYILTIVVTCAGVLLHGGVVWCAGFKIPAVENLGVIQVRYDHIVVQSLCMTK